MTPDQIDAAVKAATSKSYAAFASKFAPKSLDEAITFETDTRGVDLIAAPDLYADDRYSGADQRERGSILADVIAARAMAEEGQGWPSCLALFEE